MCSFVMVLLLAAGALAAELHVPAEFPTIQAAIDAVMDDDTVLVDVGIYAEELRTPGRRFVLRGNVEWQSGDYPRPIIDPSSLSSPRTRSCMITGFPGHMVIEDFVFRNSASMFPHQGSQPGGIENHHSGLVLRRCVFDSTHIGLVSSGNSVTVENCRFQDNIDGGIFGHNSAITATDCSVQGSSTWALVWIGSNSVLTRCQITDNRSNGHFLLAVGSDITVTDCLFGHSQSMSSVAVAADLSRSIIENCIFTECPQAITMLDLEISPCDSPIHVQGNRFIRNFEGMGTDPRVALLIHTDGEIYDRCPVYVENNIFADHDDHRGPIHVRIQANAELIRNRFVRTNRQHQPAVSLVAGQAIMRENIFFQNGLATESESFMDAEWNWWGDSTGPYHASLNPEGRGDTIRGNVDFIPWHTDTSFLIDDVRPNPALVRECELAAYPNPFNTESRIMLAVREPVIVRVDVFDITGRMVRELFKGAVAGRKEIRFDGSDLPSGIYFARASSTISRQPFNTIKLVLLK